MAKKTQLSPTATPGRRYSFSAKTPYVPVVIEGAGLILVNSQYKILPVASQTTVVDISSTNTVLLV